MTELIHPDQVHRLVKLLVDTGEVASFADAARLLATYRLAIDVGAEVCASPTLQAAVLTAVTTARRSFLGGVEVTGSLDVPLKVPWRRCQTLAEAIIDLQGRVVETIDPESPRVVVGDGRASASHGEFLVRATFEGWTGGVVPVADGHRLAESQECAPTGVLAGALAVSEAFQFVRGGNAAAGRRDVGLSLWHPEPEVSWLTTEERGPVLDRLPAKLWVIGLGHLGQAYLWTLGLLPYATPEAVELVLQDDDRLTEANDSTSVLTSLDLVGEKKTRAMARWCEQRGFQTTLVERRFADDFRVAPDEPPVALCGVDNALARAALEGVGFGRIIEAGLGTGPTEYLAFQIHSFPAQRSARSRWGSGDHIPATETLVMQPAYRALTEAGVDECGLTTLAGCAVGAPFVGAATAAIVVAELLRLIIGGQRYEVIDGSLRSPQHRRTVSSAPDKPVNLGWTMVQR